MAQTIKLKRSGTEGNIPTTSQLELGEVAINTYDGKMFIKKDVGGTESIVEISAAAADAILVEYQFTSTASQTTYSGSDDNTETLSYTPNAIQVFMNGILLDPGIDFTATNGTSIVLSEAADANDYLQIFAFKKKISDGQVSVDTFTGDDSTVAFTLSVDPGDENNTRVFIDGVYQSKANYSVSGTTLTFSTAPPTGTAVEVEIGNRVVTLDTLSDLDLPDDVKLRLGTSQDLQIYHDGSHSFISDTGTGSLYIKGGADVALRSDSDEDMLVASSNGAVTLYYDNSAKLATTNDGISVTGDVEATGEIIGDLRGATLFKAQAGEALTKGEVVYISGVSGNTTVVSKADADDASKMPAFGLVAASASSGNPVDIYTAGILADIDTSSFSEGDELFVSTTAGALTATAPTGESAALQKIGKVTRSDATGGRIFIIGAGRTNAVPNLNEGRLFVGNSSNQAVADDTVHVDIANSRVGIGTTSPSRKFEIHENTTNLTIGEKSGYTPSTYGPVFETNADALVLPGTTYLKGSQAYVGNESSLMRIHGDNGIKFSYYNGSTTTEGMRLDNSGRFGIGTNSPSAPLDVQGSTGLFMARTSSGLASYIENDGGYAAQYLYQIGGGAKVALHANGSSYFNGGNVGIGTDSPATKLEVAGTTPIIRLTDSRLLDNPSWDNVSLGSVQFYTSDTSSPGARVGAEIEAFADGDSASAPNFNLLFKTATNTGTATEKLRIDKDGRVGIGTDSPVQALDVVGSIQTDTAFRAYDSVGGAYRNVLRYDSGNVRLETGTGSTARELGIWTAGTERIRVDTSGNVGIGTTSPLAKLHVNAGEIRIASSSAYNTHLNYQDTGVNIISQANSGTTEIRNSSSTLFYLNASGKVGIGTTAPNEMLQINSADSAIRVNTTNATNNSELQLLYNNSSNGMILRYHGNSALAYIDNTYPRTQGQAYGDILFRQNYAGTMTEHMRLTAYDGYLGVFTATPKARLELNLHSGADSSLMNASTTNDVQLLRAGYGQNAGTTSNAGAKWGLRFVGRNDNTFDNGKSGAIYAVSEDALGYNREVGLAFHTSPFDAANTERMRISSEGNVGIGTDSPFNSANYKTLNIRGTNGGQILLGNSSQSYTGYLYTQSSGTVLGATSGTSLQLHADGAEKMRIDSSGNLLVGLSSSLTNGKLQIAGGIGLSGNTQIRQATNSDGNTLQVFATQLVAGSLNSSSYGYTGGGLLAGLSNLDGVVILDAGRQTSTGGRFKVVTTSSSNTSLYLEKNGTYTLYADTGSGNVGIGTSNPQTALHIYDTPAEILRMEGNDEYAYASFYGTVSSTAQRLGYMGFANDTSTAADFNFANNQGGLFSFNSAVKVTGTVTADGLTVNASNSTFNGAIGITSAAGAAISEGLLIDYSTNLARFLTYDSSTGSELAMYTQPSGGSTKQRFRINSDGDISFYEDTGTTAKFFWDSSAESLGIGQGVFSGTQALNLKGEGIAIKNDKSGSNNNWSLIRNTATASESNISFVSGAGEAMVIDHSGNIGMKGQANPAESLHIGTGQSNYIRIHNAASGDVASGITITRGNSSGLSIYDNPQDATSTFNAADHINFRTGNSSYRLNIRNNGKIGINESDPNGYLHVTGKASYTTANSSEVSGLEFVRLQPNSDSEHSLWFHNAGNNLGISGYSNAATSTPRDITLQTYGGKVGIGTSSPSVKMHIVDSDGEGLRLENQTPAPTNSVSNAPHLEFFGRGWDSNYGSKPIKARIEHTASYGDYGYGATQGALVFSVQGAGGLNSAPDTMQEGLRIAAGSDTLNHPRVGIGEGNPGAQLQIQNGSQIGMRFDTNSKSLIRLLNNTVGLGERTDLGIGFSPIAAYGGTYPLSGITGGWDDDTSGGLLSFRTSTDGGSTWPSRMVIKHNGNVLVNTSTETTNVKLKTVGATLGGGVLTYSKSYGYLGTTGQVVAGVTGGSNGGSCIFTFTGSGGAQAPFHIIYFCRNAAGSWYTHKTVVAAGGGGFDVEASTAGTTVTFTFKSTSGTEYYSPKVMIQNTGGYFVTSYLA